MPTTLFVSLKARIENYVSVFFDEKDDLDATPEDHLRATAFRILSSAAMEQFVEERCKAAAREGITRLKKGQPTTTGRSLIVWHLSRNTPGCIPVHEDDLGDHHGDASEALSSFLASADRSHGLNRRDARGLLNPIGLRSRHLSEDLLNRLQSLSERRDPAVHAVIGKARGRIGLSLEKKQVLDILDLLQEVDSDIDYVVENYPSRTVVVV